MDEARHTQAALAATEAELWLRAGSQQPGKARWPPWLWESLLIMMVRWLGGNGESCEHARRSRDGGKAEILAGAAWAPWLVVCSRSECLARLDDGGEAECLGCGSHDRVTRWCVRVGPWLYGCGCCATCAAL